LDSALSGQEYADHTDPPGNESTNWSDMSRDEKWSNYSENLDNYLSNSSNEEDQGENPGIASFREATSGQASESQDNANSASTSQSASTGQTM
jgi:hypothetical protein